ncbi:hypothetical protein D0T49_01540 [Paludibacter sp. 221]|uniref:hypothetical protein n=1 Tax=Paludibacter sp. 221 TaxID=2302939 RepID=UPI0013D21E1E|nr:hypothetical protein [Paludibacter sp. 221]NDV45733.1 hypothetical protein [Paludibacter sp. 221]
MKKPFLYIAIVVGVVCLLVIFFSMHSKEVYKVNLIENKYALSPHQEDYIYLPVTIADSMFVFLFDTGTGMNFIDIENVDGMLTDSVYVSKQKMYLARSVFEDSVAISKIDYSIGNLKLNNFMLLDGYKRYMHPKRYAAGILGGDVINQYNWLFYFDNDFVKISRRTLKINKLKNDRILSLNFKLLDLKTYVDLNVGGISIDNVMFDAGYKYYIDTALPGSLTEKLSGVDIILSDSVFTNLTNNLTSSGYVVHFNETYKGIILDSIQINDFTMHSVFAATIPDNENYASRTYITSNFVRRFRMMYYDSENKKIDLYVSPADSLVYNRKNIQELLQYIKQNPQEIIN